MCLWVAVLTEKKMSRQHGNVYHVWQRHKTLFLFSFRVRVSPEACPLRRDVEDASSSSTWVTPECSKHMEACPITVCACVCINSHHVLLCTEDPRYVLNYKHYNSRLANIFKTELCLYRWGDSGAHWFRIQSMGSFNLFSISKFQQNICHSIHYVLPVYGTCKIHQKHLFIDDISWVKFLQHFHSLPLILWLFETK